MEILQYVPFKSFVNPNFWFKLSDIKIDIDRLDDSPKKLYGWYSNFGTNNGSVEIDCTSFNENFIASRNCFTAHGTLFNKNTVEDFKNCDKSEILKAQGCKIVEKITNGAVLDDPSLLSNFLILSFADLKVHKFYYWFSFPSPMNPIVHMSSSKPSLITEVFDANIISSINNIYFDEKIDNKQKSYFFIEQIDGILKYNSLKDKINNTNLFENLDFDISNILFCFSDPSEYNYPGWNLRLFILCLHKLCPRLNGKIIKILAIRARSSKVIDTSLIYDIIMPNETVTDMEKWIGWEVNNNGKLLPKMADMRTSMDPKCLAENSINLNLKLMKWRLLPELNLDIIYNTKCLLLGAGTLGCGVARILLGWGIYNLTFLDAGHVSYSNPVRQNLYTHDDAVAGKKKVNAACERVKLIHPGAHVDGHFMMIPMPGHPVGESTHKTTCESIEILNNLILSHDVIFLLTDSRESRWLPTMLGATHNKMVINAALGFDSYVVMRHGCRQNDLNERMENLVVDGLKCIPGDLLGCYFCNDITAPGDSMKDRTLDQQCTVTRPAVSNIASALAVELMISLLQHPMKLLAPAYVAAGGNSKMNNLIPEGLLGIVPHSVRGMLCNFEQIVPGTEQFSQCIACSEKVLGEYNARGTDFIIDVLNSKQYLEDLTGITEMKSQLNDIIELDDDEFNLSE